MKNNILVRNSCSLRAKILAIYLFLLLAVALFGHLGYRSLNIAILWVLGPLLAAWVLLPRLKELFKMPWEYWAYLSLIFFAFLGLPHVVDFEGFFRYQQVILANAVLMILVFLGVTNEKEWLAVWISLFAVGIFVAVVSLFLSPVDDQTQERLTGLAANANGTANYSRVSIIAALVLMKVHMRSVWRIMLLVAIVFLGYVILMTASRGSFLNLIFIIGTYLIMRNFTGWRVIVLVCVLFLFGNFLVHAMEAFLQDFYLYERLSRFGSVTETLEGDYRFKLMGTAWELFWQNPFLGVGLNQFRVYSGGIISHTDFLDIFVQLGVIAGLVYVSIYVRTFKQLQLLKTIYKNGGIARVMDILVICLMSEIIYGLSNPNWFTQLQMVMLSLLIVGVRRIFNDSVVISRYVNGRRYGSDD